MKELLFSLNFIRLYIIVWCVVDGDCCANQNKVERISTAIVLIGTYRLAKDTRERDD